MGAYCTCHIKVIPFRTEQRQVLATCRVQSESKATTEIGASTLSLSIYIIYESYMYCQSQILYKEIYQIYHPV